MKLNSRQKENLSKAFFDVGKLVLTALVLGQFVSGKEFVFVNFIFGLIIFAICFIFATIIDKGE